MINPFSLAFGHSKIGSREIPGLVRDHRREARVLGGPSVVLELKWLRLGQAANSGNTGSSTTSVEVLQPGPVSRVDYGSVSVGFTPSC